MEAQRFWFTITWSFRVQTLKILTDAYTSRVVRGEKCYWAVFVERIGSRMLESHESLYVSYAKYENVLIEKRTLVEKAKSLIWNQTAYILCNLLNNTTTVRLKNKTLMGANCLWN